MNKQSQSLIGALALALCLAGLFLLALPVKAAPSAAAYRNTWTDDFNYSTLNNRWSWVREDSSNWSLTAQPGYMRILTQGENITYDRNNQENLLLIPVVPGDFRITTRINFTPTQNSHQAGLIIYQDDDNYLKFHRVYDSGNWVGYLWETGGSPGVCGTEVAATTVWLQITKQGNYYTGYYSLNGVDWNQVCTGGDMSFTRLKAGLEVSHDYAAISIPADFDFFTLEDNTIQSFLPTLIK